MSKMRSNAVPEVVFHVPSDTVSDVVSEMVFDATSEVELTSTSSKRMVLRVQTCPSRHKSSSSTFAIRAYPPTACASFIKMIGSPLPGS